MPFQADVEWNIPRTWGACTMALRGGEGTKFTALEFK
jgi:hypothetical protein